MDLDLVGQLIGMMNKSTLSVLEIDEQGMHIRLENHAPNLEGVTDAVVASSPLARQIATPQAQADSEPDPEPVSPDDCIYIKSPLVGTFHSTKALGYELMEPGDRVEPGQAVCAVEAMKLMNVIEAEEHGVVVKFLVEDGALVEYGQKLVMIKRL
ncbi:MAG: hypothetical protein FWG14_13240 [Peptococcaceae bacterium]|nr:hypothetical protein [Peptococcaceae bacterium]